MPLIEIPWIHTSFSSRMPFCTGLQNPHILKGLQQPFQCANFLQEIGDCVLMLEGHSGPLTDMAVAADGSLVVTTSEDGTARAWDLVSSLAI